MAYSDSQPHRYIREHPWLWAAQAVGVGASIGMGLGYLMGARGLRDFGMNAVVGIIFSCVMWAGFELFHSPFESRKEGWSPERVGLVSVLWMLALYAVLLLISISLIRFLTGVNMLRNSSVMVFTGLAGLAASGFIATKETIAGHVAAERRLVLAEARASFLSLQAQIQPHTLFNALNTIAALIPEDPRRAEEATERLSALLRRILGALEQPVWSLREEFALLEHLLRLEALRFGERLNYQLILEPAMAEQQIQPLLLLPLVENSFKHGFRPKVEACHITVRAEGGRIRIQDDGVGREEGAPDGVGLRTVRERLGASGGSLRWLPVEEGCALEVRLS
ncbi:MAG: histidine kinase [Holophagaceae bacterium]|nr:histidine kinase [Holophagaceae bacterium]